MVSIGFVISLWAGSSAVSAFVDSVVEAHDQTPLRHPVRQRFFALGIYVVMLAVAIVVVPLIALGPLKIARVGAGQLGQRAAVRLLPGAWAGARADSHRALPGLTAQATADSPAGAGRGAGDGRLPDGQHGLQFYLQWITSTGYTYGALATPIAFLLFAFFLGFAVVIGAELNNAIQEQWPAPSPHAHRFRWWLKARAEEIVSDESVAENEEEPARQPNRSAPS